MENKPTFAFAKSLIYVARFHLEKGGGDFARALTYAERVAQSNAEEVVVANELLRRMQFLTVDTKLAAAAGKEGKDSKESAEEMELGSALESAGAESAGAPPDPPN